MNGNQNMKGSFLRRRLQVAGFVFLVIAQIFLMSGCSSGALIDNPFNRYQFNDASNLSKNPDGSVDICFQATKPIEDEAFKNWLPVANSKGFQVMFRLLAPHSDQIQDILDGIGWQPSALVIKND